MPSRATCRLVSPRKKFPISFGICTMCSALPCSRLPCSVVPLLIRFFPSRLLDCRHVRGFQQTLLSLAEVTEALLPLGGLADPGCLYSRHFVLGAIGRPI